MTFIDSHSHLYLKEFAGDLPQVIERARLSGVSHILLPNIDSTTVDDMLAVCNSYPGYCFPMIGLHPGSVNETYREELTIMENRLDANSGFIAVGEVGVDLYWDKTFVKEQLYAFDFQIRLALKCNLPLVVHTREAFNEVYDTLLPYKDTGIRGVFHSFIGTGEEAQKLLEFENFMLGINGVVTFKNSILPVALESVPLERVILETDSPYLTPMPNRGKRNESSNLRYTLIKVAELYRKTAGEIAEVTTANTLKVFGSLR